MSERFYVDRPVETDATSVELAGPEAHHLLHVMRAKVGDEVTLFDGGGAEFRARVESLSRSSAGFEVLQRWEVDRELPAPLTIAAALPKGDRQRWMVEKLTELGVTRLAPIVTERSVAKLSGGGLDKLRRAVVEASKQCGRNRLMAIDEPAPWAGVLAEPTEGRRFIAHPSGNTAPAPAGAPEPTVVAIGPEGGFSDGEVKSAFAAGWAPMGFGPRILRTETAAVAAAVWATSAGRR